MAVEMYDADARMKQLREDAPEFKIGGVVYVSEVPTLDDQAEIAKLLPDGKATDAATMAAQIDSIRAQIKRFLKRKDKPADNKPKEAKQGQPPPDADLGKLSPKVCGEILARINQDEEDEPGN